MAEFDWGRFAQSVGRAKAGFVADIQSRQDDKRKLALYKEKQKIDLEGLNRELEVREPFKEKADKRIEDRLKEIANFEQDLKEDWLQYESKYKANLEGALFDPMFLEMKSKAVKSGDTAQQTLILGLENEINAVLGGKKEFDPRALKGLSPVATQNMAKISYERSQEKIKVQQADEKIQNDKGQTLALREYRKELARGRALTEQRLAGSAVEVSAQRFSAERTRLDTAVEKAETSFDKYRVDLLTELEDTNKINKKGEAFAKIGGATKVSLLDDAGGINEEAVKKFVKHYPRYRGRFKRLEVLRENVEIRNARRDEFFGGEPANIIRGEADIPEPEIKKGMDLGLTREEASQWYKDMKTGK